MADMATLTSQVTFRVSTELYDRINEIAVAERRKPNEVARALLERGSAAYNRDGQLFEPSGLRLPVITVRDKKEQGRRKAG